LTDNNIYWDTRTKDIMFGDATFSEWKRSGKDPHSIIADPQFVNPYGYDFRLKSKSVVKKIDFVPFDFSKAGVYGSEGWKKMAEFDPELARKFNEIMEGN
jgi:hypothetical protein